jgi:hypothetical protein
MDKFDKKVVGILRVEVEVPKKKVVVEVEVGNLKKKVVVPKGVAE